MKNWMTAFFASCSVLMSACSTVHTDKLPENQLGLANPASVYCVKLGGKSIIKNEEAGQTGYCQLPNGSVKEEWSLYRASQQCLPDAAQQLVGQIGLSDSQIQSITQAQIVRKIQPGQPVTMDYREERVTVVEHPVSKKIIQANCG